MFGYVWRCINVYVHLFSRFINPYTFAMALPKFYLEPRKPSHDNDKNLKLAINMFYSFYGERLQYYTGIRIDPKFYKSEDSKGNPIERSEVNKLISDNAPYAAVIKANLRQIALDVQNIANTAKANRIPVTKKYLTTELDLIHKHKPEDQQPVPLEYNFVSFYEKLIIDSKASTRVMQKGKNAGHAFSHNAIKNYKSTLSAIKRYMAAKRLKTLKFDDVNKGFYDQFKAFCYGPSENKEKSTFAGFIKDIKAVMNEAKEAGHQSSDGHKAASFILPSYESDTKALTMAEVDQIHSLNLSANPRMDKVRDLFLIGCYSALRFSNFNNLKVENVTQGFLRLKQVKTSDLVTIPIIKRLQMVLDKYEGALPKPVSNQEFNRVIKEVVKAAGLDYMVQVKSFNGGIEKTDLKPLNELISSHTARRSYATNMFKLGIPTMLIMSATGHKTESSFLKYIRANNEDKAMLMAEHLRRLGL
jgi:integrase